MVDTNLSPAELVTRARELAGNWESIPDFGWADAPDPRHWTRVDISNRDSGPLDLSNAAVIECELLRADPDGNDHWQGRSSHWACGYVDTVVVRVWKEDSRSAVDGGTGRSFEQAAEDLTPAFVVLCELQASMEDYPVLDEMDLSAREYEDLLETIENCVRLDHDHDGISYVSRDPMPDDWSSQIAGVLENVSSGEDLREEDALSAARDLYLAVPDMEGTKELREKLRAVEVQRDTLLEMIADVQRDIRSTDELTALAREIEEDS